MCVRVCVEGRDKERERDSTGGFTSHTTYYSVSQIKSCTVHSMNVLQRRGEIGNCEYFYFLQFVDIIKEAERSKVEPSSTQPHKEQRAKSKQVIRQVLEACPCRCCFGFRILFPPTATVQDRRRKVREKRKKMCGKRGSSTFRYTFCPAYVQYSRMYVIRSSPDCVYPMAMAWYRMA